MRYLNAPQDTWVELDGNYYKITRGLVFRWAGSRWVVSASRTVKDVLKEMKLQDLPVPEVEDKQRFRPKPKRVKWRLS